MKVGTLLRIFNAITPVLEKYNVLDQNDDFHEPSVLVWAEMAAEIETILKAHGVEVDQNVDKILQVLPAIIGLIGISA